MKKFIFILLAISLLLGKRGTDFCHAPQEQLLSVVLAPLVLILLIMAVLGHAPTYGALVLSWLWFLLNMRFLAFLTQEKGLFLRLSATWVTFMHLIVMAVGIACGSFAFMVGQSGKEKGAT